MDPNLILAGAGILSSVFGGKPSQPKYLKDNVELTNQAIRDGLALYHGTNLADQDQQTLGQYSTAAMKQAMALLGNNEARFAGAGSAHAKFDTQKDRAQNQIASDSGQQVASLGAQLSSTRPQRMAALLPNAAAAAGGAQAAAMLDQSELLRQQQETGGLMDAASVIAKLLKKGGGAAAGRNDAAPLTAYDPSILNPKKYDNYNPLTGGYGSYGL